MLSPLTLSPDCDRISAQRCREYLTSHRAAQQAEKECLQRQQAEFQARMAELDRRNRAQRIGGRPAVSRNALADRRR